MKASILFLGLILIAANAIASEETQGLSSGPKKIMFKADKEFVGGEIQILNSDKSLIISKKLKKRKLSIDFSNATIGAYTVRFLKDGHQSEYYYLNR